MNFLIDEWIRIKNKLPPHDGTEFLGYDPNKDSGKIYVLVFEPAVTYHGKGFERCSREECYRESSGERYFKWEPTHWMPLPESPSERK